jgi:hypothetical protein
MDFEEYLTLLDENLLLSAHKLGLKIKQIFWQDNDSEYLAKIITELLQEKKAKELP